MPGTSAYALIYGEFLKALADRGYNVVGFDPRGHGRSGGERGSYTIPELVSDMKAAVEYAQKRFGDPIVVAGSSQGGSLQQVLLDDELLQMVVMDTSRLDLLSDPLADGATIQQASFQALKHGVSPKLCLEVAGQLSREVNIPLVFMTYFNPVFSYGLEAFCRDCATTGIGGLIVPDLPPGEGEALEAATRGQDIDLIYLLAPTSTEERVRLVAERSRGFIYLVSVAGITGARDSLPAGLDVFVSRVRKVTALPLCIGFGISTSEQASQVASIADGVIIGSRIIQLMESDQPMKAVQDFCIRGSARSRPYSRHIMMTAATATTIKNSSPTPRQ